MNHVGALRVSLLLAMGVVPGACGGTVQRGNQDGEGADSASGGSGTTRTGGTKPGTAGRATGTAGTGGKMLPPSGGTGAGGATETPLHPPLSCTGGKLNPLTGLVTCSQGYVHRVQKVECVGSAGAPADASAGASFGGAGGNEDAQVLPRADASVSCGNNETLGYIDVAVCSRFEFGYCFEEFDDDGLCVSGCTVDEDCGEGAICECGHPESPSGGVCVPTTGCQTDADCDGGTLCASFAGCGAYGFACFSETDECHGEADCGGAFCTLERDGHRVCQHVICE
jgi:hypothetical protein